MSAACASYAGRLRLRRYRSRPASPCAGRPLPSACTPPAPSTPPSSTDQIAEGPPNRRLPASLPTPVPAARATTGPVRGLSPAQAARMRAVASRLGPAPPEFPDEIARAPHSRPAARFSPASAAHFEVAHVPGRRRVPGVEG
jgi:hypothetical protein